MFEPRLSQTVYRIGSAGSVKVILIAMDGDPNAVGMANGSGFFHGKLDLLEVERLKTSPGQSVGQGFEQLEAGVLGEVNHPLGYGFVVYGILDIIGLCGRPNVRGDFVTDEHRLFNLPFPVVNANDAVDFEFIKENRIPDHGEESSCQWIVSWDRKGEFMSRCILDYFQP